MNSQYEELLEEADLHAITVGPNMGICVSDGMWGTPVGAVLRDECLLVQQLAAALRESEERIEKAVVALNAEDDSPGVPDQNEWADRYRVMNALAVLHPEEGES